MNMGVLSLKSKKAVLSICKHGTEAPLEVLEDVAMISKCRVGLLRGMGSLEDLASKVLKQVESIKKFKAIIELFEATTVLEPAEYQIENESSIFGKGHARVYDIWLGHEVWHKVVVDHGDGSHSLHYFNVQVDNNPLDDEDDEKTSQEVEECSLPQ